MGITILAIFILPLVSALINLPLTVLYEPLVVRLPLKLYLDLEFGVYLGNSSPSQALALLV
ncbi:hypothetical protein [Okeania sp. SIO2C2]|uniref:hypothetical protein n=1 Tax=Okeania sp. SIO2C2 TaxID=2607787 RepID=UPI00257A90EC|nr:hypothetical protein [Okeania sp. SIO2C2]